MFVRDPQNSNKVDAFTIKCKVATKGGEVLGAFLPFE